MMRGVRAFTPVGRIVHEPETLGQKLQRLARESLPVVVVTRERKSRARRYCACGAKLHANPKVRQKQMVCDDCADIIPRLETGRPFAYVCVGCRGSFPRRALNVRRGKYYCQKCLKKNF